MPWMVAMWGWLRAARARASASSRWSAIGSPNRFGDRDFSARFRYRLAAFVPLNRPTIEPGAWFLRPMGEAFSDLGEEAEELFAARLRLSLGVGYEFNEDWRLEVRYTAQKSRDTITDVFSTTDHILDVRLRTSHRIRDLVRFW